MNNRIILSYVLTTFNKLSYLKITLPLLIAARKDDEEIVIADGGSSDGTAEYLDQLFKEGKIQGFISEKDNGEAHGINKAILISKGTLLKIITDDDVYSFPVIEKCKHFMMENTNVDIIGFDGFGCGLSNTTIQFQKSNYIEGYKKWLTTKEPFLFCGLSMMIRKASLAYLGLFNTKFKMVDVEYAMRISSLKINISFYTGLGYINIANPDSNQVKFATLLEKERKLVYKTYLPNYSKYNFQQIKTDSLNFLVKLKNILKPSLKINIEEGAFANTVYEGISHLEKYNNSEKNTFLINH